MTTMTVKKLKKMLDQFDDNALIGLFGGEDAGGSFAFLCIGNIKHYKGPNYEYDDFCEEHTLMEYSD